MHWPRSAPPCIEPYGRRQQGNTGLSRQSAASAEVSLHWSRTHRQWTYHVTVRYIFRTRPGTYGLFDDIAYGYRNG